MKHARPHTAHTLSTLRKFADLRRRGFPVKEVARRTGMSHPTYYRLRKRLVTEGRLHRAYPLRLPDLLSGFGLGAGTVELLRTHRIAVGCVDARMAIRWTVANPQCPAREARLLTPYGRGTKPLPDFLERVLKLEKVPLLKVRCGRHEAIRVVGHGRGGAK